ncbi:MAG: ABC transporter substrate-binding protein [Chloroflexota bacterium]|nr:ABC transporter substrate-binding protein [Chloroflexota bacterium]
MRRSRLMLVLSMLLAGMLVLAACAGAEEDAGVAEEEPVVEPVVEEEEPVVEEEEPVVEEEEPVVEEEEPVAEEEEPVAEAGEAGACNEVTMIASGVGQEFETLQTLAAQFEEERPGITVELVEAAEAGSERLGQYLQCFATECTDLDIFQIDVIWTGDLAEHLVDMSQYVEPEVIEQHFPAIIENNTVDGQLVALPWFTDAALLYYRTDLLEEYGFDGPPETWEELEEMAATIQEGERADNPDFAGYVWQGNAYEGLTCNAIEWIASNDGGTIVSPEGTITVFNDNAIAAIDNAAEWVGTISPSGVTGFQEEDARTVWHAGNAAFMRNWPYAYSLSQESDAIAGNFDVMPLPNWEGAEAESAACLGGWQLAVSRYSQCQDLAGEFAAFLTSAEAQRLRALEASLIPTIESLYEDPEVVEAVPPNMLDVLRNATPRPSTATAPNYAQVSNIFFSNVHNVLTGQTDAETALAEVELELEDLLGFPTGEPE